MRISRKSKSANTTLDTKALHQPDANWDSIDDGGWDRVVRRAGWPCEDTQHGSRPARHRRAAHVGVIVPPTFPEEAEAKLLEERRRTRVHRARRFVFK